jgi:hypothetical protein
MRNKERPRVCDREREVEKLDQQKNAFRNHAFTAAGSIYRTQFFNQTFGLQKTGFSQLNFCSIDV